MDFAGECGMDVTAVLLDICCELRASVGGEGACDDEVLTGERLGGWGYLCCEL